MKLHHRLRELRAERNLYLREVAARCELSVPYLSDLERGRLQPSLQSLHVLAAAYDITVRDLLHGVDFHAGQPALAPAALQELIDHPTLGADLTPEWVQTLLRVELRGRRPSTRDDWYSLFRVLRRVLP